jgi:hypothetical protein|tara:strand:+ start:2611 stop:3102 length:492 start_codon:yes stop_codon:yes gene_type:complete
MNQSRGGDTVSQGGTTSATTAIGNHDLSHENRSGHSGHENFHNISGGVTNQNSGSANAFGDQSHKSTSDRERTPTGPGGPDAYGQQPTSWREDHGQPNQLLTDKAMNKAIEGAEAEGDGKQKDPYYFTFFNEKNESGKGGEAISNTQPRNYQGAGDNSLLDVS